MFSIIICTYNRSDVLQHCLQSFKTEVESKVVEFEIIVVDNNSTDNTREIVLSFERELPLCYVKEEAIGLSFARNKGYHEASFDWVIYIDDDAKVHKGFLERAKWIVDNFTFDGFGGRCFPWYLTPKPAWLPADFGLMPKFLKAPGVLPPDKHAQGMVMAFKKDALQAVGGFPSNLGMTGNTVGYGEENWVQDRMREQGYSIGFDPELKVDHLVASYKYSLSWHFRRQYAKGKAASILKKKNSNAFGKIIWAIGVTSKGLIVNSLKLFRRNYFYQNYLLDTFGFLVKTFGQLNKHE
jgi:glucosyl-dolichyl phosphate glucuronosyltransferase